MALPDGMRHTVAGLAAAVAFLAAFFGLTLVWWLALLMGIGVWAGTFLIVPRRRPLDEIKLSTRVTAADVSAAAQALDEAADRLESAANEALEADAVTIRSMAHHVRSICRSIKEDPEDYRPTRRFVGFYLPNMVQTVENYARLAGRAHGEGAERVAALSERLVHFASVTARIDAACLENDLRALEVEVDVLATQLDRVPTKGIRA